MQSKILYCFYMLVFARICIAYFEFLDSTCADFLFAWRDPNKTSLDEMARRPIWSFRREVKMPLSRLDGQ
jgi:hypothetical protein